MDGLMLLSLVETLDTLEDPRVDRTPAAQPDGHPGAARAGGHLRCRQFRGHRPVWSAQRSLAAHLSGAAARDPFA